MENLGRGGLGSGVRASEMLGEVEVEISVVPLNLLHLMEELEFADSLFGDLGGEGFVVRIAEIDSAAQGAAFACGAEVVDLKRAAGSCDLCVWRKSLFEKEIRFGLRDVKSMAVFVEATTSSAEITARGERGDLLIDFRIDRLQSGSDGRREVGHQRIADVSSRGFARFERVMGTGSRGLHDILAISQSIVVDFRRIFAPHATTSERKPVMWAAHRPVFDKKRR